MTLRIAVADDSVLLREGLIRVLEEGGFEVVGGFGDAESLLAAIGDLTPDVVILDVRMPPTFRDEGVRAAVELRDRFPSLGILLLSQYVEVTYAQELLSSGRGGVGYLLKDRVASLVELQDAVQRVAGGGTVLDPEVVANRICEAVDAVGDRSRVIASSDCGFGTFAGSELVAEEVVWAKLKSCREGADIATRRLWGKG